MRIQFSDPPLPDTSLDPRLSHVIPSESYEDMRMITGLGSLFRNYVFNDFKSFRTSNNFKIIRMTNV